MNSKSALPVSGWINRSMFIAPLFLSGCWTAPLSNVQPKGPPRLIQQGIAVTAVRDPALVKSVDPVTRTVVVSAPGQPGSETYRVGTRVSNFDALIPNDTVKARLAEKLSIFVLGGDGQPTRIRVDARVLEVDPSFRVLTVQYPDGRDEAFKVGLGVKLAEMEAGDSVMIDVLEAVSLKMKRP